MQSQTSVTATLMQALAELEARFPVAEWRVEDVPVWPLIRIRWFLSEWSRHYVSSTGGSKAATFAARLAWGPVRTAAAQRRNSARSGPARRDLLFLTDGVSYARLGGRWLERFCDPVIRAAAERGLTTRLLSPTYFFREPLATHAWFIQPQLDRANVLAALRVRLLGARARLPAVREVCAWLAAQGLGSGSLQPAKVTSDGARVRALARVYERFVSHTQPRLAFLVSYYGVEGMAFVLACRNRGVTVVDLQHGAPGELHPAYANLPKPAGGVHALLPDRFWVWSDWERRMIARWAEGTAHRAVVGGDPWMSVWEPARGWQGVEEAAARADALLARAGTRPTVLVTLQWGLHPREQLEPARRLIADGHQRFAFWLRLHPSMLERREEVRALMQGAGAHELDEPTDLPLPILLARSAVHVTHSSSAAVEAAQFGVRTVVTADLGMELYARLVEAGWVSKETGEPAQVLALLVRLAKERRAAAPARVPLDEALDQLLAES